MPAHSHLAAAWVETARGVGGRGDLAGAGAALLRRWVEPQRVYHDIRHLDAVLRSVEQLRAHASQPNVVRVAVWFHDAVYDPTRGDNEVRSAALAEQALLDLRVPDALVREVGRLVRLTRTHDPGPADVDGAVLCDADLAVLAWTPERYTVYAREVRSEYAHVSDAAFSAGRAEILRGLLARPELYRTPQARAWEPRARANVEAELRALES